MNASVWLTKTTPRRFSRSSSSWLIAASTESGRTSRLTLKLERHLTASFINTLAYSGHGYADTDFITTYSKQHELTRNATRKDSGILRLSLRREGCATACRPSIRLSNRPSVTLRYVFHTGWNTSKIIQRPNSLRYLLGLTSTWAIWSNRSTPKIGWNWGGVMSTKTCNISETGPERTKVTMTNK